MAGTHTSGLQGQDLNLRSSGYEPDGMTSSPPCQRKTRRRPKMVRRAGGTLTGLLLAQPGHICEARSFGGLRKKRRTGNVLWPISALRPIGRKPMHNFIVFFRSERLAITNSRKKPPIRGAKSTNSRLVQTTHGAEPFG